MKRLWLVTQLDFAKRVRSSRWMIGLIVWAAMLALFIGFVMVVSGEIQTAWNSIPPLTMLFTLVIAMVITGTSGSAAINGERADATLALLQATPARGSEIVIGKIIAAWLAAMGVYGVGVGVTLVFALITTPGVFGHYVIAALAGVFMLLCVAAIGVGYSSLTPRPVGAATMLVLTIGFALVGTPMVVGILSQATATRVEFNTHYCYVASDPWMQGPGGGDGSGDGGRAGGGASGDGAGSVGDGAGSGSQPERQCEPGTGSVELHHNDRYWGVLLVNPVVAISDAMPASAQGWVSTPDPVYGPEEGDFKKSGYVIEPTNSLNRSIALLRNGAYEAPIVDDMTGEQVYAGYGKPLPAVIHTGRFWPISLGLYALLGAGMSAVAIRRTSVPLRKLGRSVRVA
ncbi:MAG: ABC transporter permease subunit [Bowdeniella nasicola]|nr:ABC transporter permease subunit [Bowdeniella nasicola]